MGCFGSKQNDNDKCNKKIGSTLNTSIASFPWWSITTSKLYIPFRWRRFHFQIIFVFIFLSHKMNQDIMDTFHYSQENILTNSIFLTMGQWVLGPSDQTQSHCTKAHVYPVKHTHLTAWLRRLFFRFLPFWIRESKTTAGY